jgi:hypothetical protein
VWKAYACTVWKKIRLGATILRGHWPMILTTFSPTERSKLGERVCSKGLGVGVGKTRWPPRCGPRSSWCSCPLQRLADGSGAMRGRLDPTRSTLIHSKASAARQRQLATREATTAAQDLQRRREQSQPPSGLIESARAKVAARDWSQALALYTLIKRTPLARSLRKSYNTR